MQDPRSVERLQRGDVATLKRLFKANHTMLLPLAFRLTKSRDAAGQVIRGAFKQLWHDRAQLDVFDPLDLKLVHGVYEHAMSYRAEHGISGYAVTSDREGGSNSNVPEIDGIAEEDRLNYLLYIVDGYSFRELARAYERPIEDVQVSVGRAIASLRESPEQQQR